MGDIVINLDQMTAGVVLPENLIAEKLTFIEPFCSKLSPTNAASLRQDAIRNLKLLYYLKDAIPPDAPPTKQAVKEMFLRNVISESEFFNTQLSAMEGATSEDRLKAFFARERALFDSDPNQWWQHRVRESYDFNAFMEKASASNKPRQTSTGCLVPIMFLLTLGTGLITWRFYS